MTLDEVEKYISNGSRSQVCIMRKPVDGLSLLIMSFYIMGKPGLLSFYDEEIDNEQYQKEENVFIDELLYGEVLLPAELTWKKKPI